jgi:hypothetical protein
VDTLCHELAHLKHFDHGVRFQAFYRRMLEYARRQGIYRPSRRPLPLRPPLMQRRAQAPPVEPVRVAPAPQRPSRPIQLDLFPPGAGEV